MTGTRKRYSASFKARVALEAAKQTKTLAELSGRYQVHSIRISQWKTKRRGSGRGLQASDGREALAACVFCAPRRARFARAAAAGLRGLRTGVLGEVEGANLIKLHRHSEKAF